MNVNYYYIGRFIKYQQNYAELMQLFTRAWKNRNIERKKERETKKLR